jgi:DNA polymerase III subunit delta'
VQNLTLNPQTKKQLELAIIRQPQVLILHGKLGVGLHTIANAMALKISDKHNLLEIMPDDKGNLKIDAIRRLYNQTRTKRDKKLVILIDNADSMLAPAQNALLKLLEDTPKGCVFLLTTHHPQLLLPTVRSRAQEIDVLPISSQQTSIYLKDKAELDITKQPQVLFLAGGLPAELYRLIENEEYFDTRVRQMSEAKAFLAKNLYEKLITMYKLPSDRSAAFTLLQDSMRIIEMTLRSRPDPNMATLLQKLLSTEQKLHSDGHVRTQLLNFAVSTS